MTLTLSKEEALERLERNRTRREQVALEARIAREQMEDLVSLAKDAGLSMTEIAQALDINRASAYQAMYRGLGRNHQGDAA